MKHPSESKRLESLLCTFHGDAYHSDKADNVESSPNNSAQYGRNDT